MPDLHMAILSLKLLNYGMYYPKPSLRKPPINPNPIQYLHPGSSTSITEIFLFFFVLYLERRRSTLLCRSFPDRHLVLLPEVECVSVDRGTWIWRVEDLSILYLQTTNSDGLREKGVGSYITKTKTTTTKISPGLILWWSDLMTD